MVFEIMANSAFETLKIFWDVEVIGATLTGLILFYFGTKWYFKQKEVGG